LDSSGNAVIAGGLTLGSTLSNGTYTYTLPGATGTLALVGGAGVGTVTSVGLSSATSGVTIGSTPITTSGTITLAIATASGSQQGLLSSTDWTTFNNKQSALTNPVTGTGTTNYLPKFTGASTIGNSQIFDNGSNVGINTATPNTNSRLTISDGTSISAYWRATNTNAATRDWCIITNNANFGDFAIRQGNSQGADATAGTDRLLLSASGNLGLGTNAPVNLLHLYGTDGNSYIRWTSDVATTGARIGYNGTEFRIDQQQNADITFRTNGSEKMRLTASGNLGLGVTPSAWSLVVPAFQVNSASFSSYDNSANIGSNFFYNGSSDRYINNGFASLYQQYQSKHMWLTAPSGTAGNAITFTQAMTLDASGQLSLGITAATGNANRILHINGADSAELHLTRSNSGSSSTFGGYVNFDGSNNFNIQNRTGGSVNLITGTTTALAIASTGAATFSSSVSGSLIRANDGVFQLYRASAFRGGLYTFDAAIGSGTDYSSTLTSETDINFLTGGSITKKVTFLANGNVGIGSASPVGFASDDLVLQISNPTGGGSAMRSMMRFTNVNSGTAWGNGTFLGLDSTLDFYIGQLENAPIIFQTNATERMRITSGGNVGIGSTTSAWSLGTTLQIGGNNAAINFSGTAAILGIVNAYYNGSSYIHQNTGTVASFEYGLAVANSFNWRMSPSANAGSTASLGVVMSLSNAGNLEINTGSIKTGEPDTGYGRAAFKIGTRQSGTATDSGGYIPISIDGTVYFINLYTSTP